MKIALLHYTYPPIIGGVETVVERQAALFADHGYEVRVISGSGVSLDPRVNLIAVPELSASHPTTQGAQEEIDLGEPGTQFQRLLTHLKGQLAAHLNGVDVAVIHNLLSMPFNLACTEALRQIASEQNGTRFIAWIHDLAACNPDYHLPERAPWDILRQRLPYFEYVAVSEHRQRQFSELTSAAEDRTQRCKVIPNGINALEFLNLTPQVAQFLSKHNLLSRDALLLCPARLLKRKNLEAALEIVAALKIQGASCACLITGACDPHNLQSVQYADDLRKKVSQWNLANEVFFISDFFAVTNPDLVSLYEASDAVIYPSLQEGFGIPLLEAAVHRLPVFCSNLEPLKDLALSNAIYLDRHTPPSELAKTVREVIQATSTSRKDVLHRFSWEAIFAHQIEPLIREIL